MAAGSALAAGVAKTGVNWLGIAKGLGSVGSFLGGLGSLFGHSGGTSTKDSMALMSFQEKLQERYLRNYYSNARQSLNDAGYNPMLAYMNTVSGGQTSATAQEGNEVGQRAQAVANIIQSFIAKAQVENTNANTVKQLAEAQTESERPELIRQQAIGQGLSNILTQKGIDWYEKEKQAEIYLKYATGYGAVTGSNAQQTMADTNKYGNPFKTLITLFRDLPEDTKSVKPGNGRSYWDKMQTDSYRR